MTDRPHSALSAAIASIACDAKLLLQEHGLEDRGSIFWASFSDDCGKTRIVYRSHKSVAAKDFSLLNAADLRDGFRSARRQGVRKQMWGLMDGVVE